MDISQPTVVILAGCNGAGKTTASRSILADQLKLTTFVNADVIAKGLAGFDPDSVAWEASRIMLARLDQLATSHKNFAFETTLAARSFEHRIREWRQKGYRVLLFYFSVASPDVAVLRVAARVKQGGHDVPEDTIRRRYQRSLSNLFSIYLPLVDGWWVYNSSEPGEPKLIAEGGASQALQVVNNQLWEHLQLGIVNDQQFENS